MATVLEGIDVKFINRLLSVERWYDVFFFFQNQKKNVEYLNFRNIYIA